MRAKRVDTNQAEIIAALRDAGYTVEPLHAVGEGVRQCAGCGVPFTPGKRSKKGWFCSGSCACRANQKRATALRNPRRLVVCEWCGIEFRTYHPIQRFCSRKCSGKGKAKPMRHRGGKVDANQNEVVQALRDVGASVIVTSDIGISGFPDLVVGFRGSNYLLEVKNPNGGYGRRGFNRNQVSWNNAWRGSPTVIVHTSDEALKAIGAI